jgi:hypothetical protein
MTINSILDAFDQALREVPYRAAAELISSKIAEEGIELRPRELEKLVEYLKSGGGDDFRFRTWRWWENRELTVSLTDAETQEVLDRLNRFLEGGLDDLIKSIADDLSRDILVTLHRMWKREARRQTRERGGFERHLTKRWGSAIDRLRMTLTAAREFGESVNGSIRGTESSSPYLVDVLTRLHARACQIAEEIICLLESGFSDGAMARWRTLHEISATAHLLSESGERLAVRYVEHEAIESFRAATDYRECSSRLGYVPMGNEEYEEVRRKRDSMIDRYGKDFSSQYGWAAEVIGKPTPTLRDIQEAAGIDHFRPYYRMASHNVHANPMGIYFKLGLLDKTEVLLAGRSSIGLAYPGHGCAISLMQVTTALCVLKPDLDSLVALRILGKLTDEVGTLFGEAHERVTADGD